MIVGKSRASRRNKLTDHVTEATIFSSVAKQVVLEPPTEHSLLVTISASSAHTVKLRATGKSIRVKSVAYGAIDTLLFELLNILVFRISTKTIH